MPMSAESNQPPVTNDNVPSKTHNLKSTADNDYVNVNNIDMNIKSNKHNLQSAAC